MTQREVIVQFSGDRAELSSLGLAGATSFDDYAIGWIDASRLPALTAHPSIKSIAPAPSVRRGLDESVDAIHVPAVWNATPAYKGRGVIVGIIDSGIDIAHANFRHPADRRSRILRLWDQNRSDVPKERAPQRFRLAGFNGGSPIPSIRYGAEYTQDELTEILRRAPDTRKEFPGREDPREIAQAAATQGLAVAHGTHVAGIAAGNGIQSTYCHGPNTYIGVAPESDLVIVKQGNGLQGLIDAFFYIINFASTPGNFADGKARPVAINCSLGVASAPYNPEIRKVLVEPLNALLAASPSRVIVAAAMNDADSGIHARVALQSTAAVDIPFSMPQQMGVDAVLDLAFTAGPAVDAVIASPKVGGQAKQLTAPTAAEQSVVVDGHTVKYRLGATPVAPHAATLSIIIEPPSSGGLPGTWRIRLTKAAGAAVTADAWIRTSVVANPVFSNAAQRDPSDTMASPARGESVIAVGNYSSLPGSVNQGKVVPTSGQGRMGATAAETKPDVIAPGEGITSVKSTARRTDSRCSACCVDYYIKGYGGTSMAAPHVTGVVALMLEKNRTLSFTEVREKLRASAAVPPGESRPNHRWGFGLVNAEKAVSSVPASSSPVATVAGVIEASDVRIAPNFDNPDPPAHRVAEQRVEHLLDTPADAPSFTVPWPTQVPGLVQRVRALDPLLSRSIGLQALLALVSTHVDEVERLTRANRRVATVWRRKGGPALLQHLMRTSTLDGAIIPHRVAGYCMVALLRRFVELLQRYGSDGLRADAERYGGFVLCVPGASLHDLDRLLDAGAS